MPPNEAIWRHSPGSVVWWHQSITCTIADASSVRFCGIDLKEFSKGVPNYNNEFENYIVEMTAVSPMGNELMSACGDWTPLYKLGFVRVK